MSAARSSPTRPLSAPPQSAPTAHDARPTPAQSETPRTSPANPLCVPPSPSTHNPKPRPHPHTRTPPQPPQPRPRPPTSKTLSASDPTRTPHSSNSIQNPLFEINRSTH